MADSKKYDGSQWEHSLRKLTTATDTFTTLPAVLYLNDTTATVGLKGQMEQSSQPSPTNPIQPSECGDRTENLCEKVEAPLSQYRIYIENFKSIIDNYSTFTLIFNTQLSYSGNTLYLYTGSNTTLGYITGTGTITKTFNLNAENKEAIKNATNPYIFVYANNVDQSSNTNAMLVSGSTAPSSFIPYGYKLDIKSASTTTPVYLGEVQTTRKIKKVVLDGTESGMLIVGNENHIFAIRGIFNSEPNLLQVGGVCTHFKYNNAVLNLAANMQNGDFVLNKIVDDYSFTIKNDSFNTVNDFKTYLQQQYANGTPVTIWYVLSTPQTAVVNEPIRKIGNYADTVSGITIPTISGKDSFDVETALKPSEATLSYTGWHDATVEEWDGSDWQ